MSQKMMKAREMKMRSKERHMRTLTKMHTNQIKMKRKMQETKKEMRKVRTNRWSTISNVHAPFTRAIRLSSGHSLA
jgi:hypothetical protein